MRNGFKIFTALASMVLSLSLIVFGVYAIMTESKLEVKNNIEFVVDNQDGNVDVDFEIDYYKYDALKVPIATAIANLDDIEFDEADVFEVGGQYYVGYLANIVATDAGTNFGSLIEYKFSNVSIEPKLNIYLIDGRITDVQLDQKTDLTGYTALIENTILDHGTTLQAKEFTVLVLFEIDVTVPGAQQLNDVGFTVTAKAKTTP